MEGGKCWICSWTSLLDSVFAVKRVKNVQGLKELLERNALRYRIRGGGVLG